MRKSLVVIPTYNEAESIVILLNQLAKVDVDVLVIDDGSPDGTADICRAQGVEVVERAGKAGLGSAYRAGFAIALDHGYENIIEMDADGSHQVSDLILMMAWIGSADLLIGSRWVADGQIRNWSKFREYLSKAANKYANVVLGLGVADTTAGFRIYSGELLKKMDIQTIASEGYCFQIEMTRRALARGARIAEVPITFIEREFGVSKMSFGIALEAVLRITAWGFLRIIGR